MSKLVVSEFLTLDGVMQAPGYPDEDRNGGFEHGGRQRPYFDPVAGAAVNAERKPTAQCVDWRIGDPRVSAS
jgi:hypothetical protein